MADAFDFGANTGIVDEMYRQYLENPESVSSAWRDFFADYSPRFAQAESPTQIAETSSTPAIPTAAAPLALLEGEAPAPLRGAAAKIAENMEASLGIPTATSVRAIPAKLLEINRLILNNHLSRVGGSKVSFTHIIAYATVKAIQKVPAMNSSYGMVDGKPSVARHGHLNLGLAVDVKKSDGTRTLLVPNIKHANTLDFAGFFAAYEELIRKARASKFAPDDFSGTTASITNPGMIGTVHSVPRLMPGQGFILGVGSIDYPAEYQAADPQVLAQIGVSKVITLTSTYDHRIIQGAESGEFLGWIHKFLLGDEGFYDELFHSFAIPYEPARWSVDHSTPDEDSLLAHEKAVHVYQLINMYRVRGHLIANLDPLGLREPKTHPELDPNHYGLTIWDLEREFPTGGLGGHETMKLGEILGILRDAYSRTVGLEYMHIQDPQEKEWIQERVEGVRSELSIEEKKRILDRLNASEVFERFLHTKYLGHKRFSLEGSESLIPMLGELFDLAADQGMEQGVLGMAHRGRLNVLTNVMGKSYNQTFREFEGELDPATTQGSGDVKYHLGSSGKHVSPSGSEIALTLASNPSHLEAVDPVVEGMVRALQDARHDTTRSKVCSVLIHGDAAFAGQGVVAETLNLSGVAGYEIGGTVHIIINNQLGFTTPPQSGRSSHYATDVAQTVEAPIIHVNGDDPEACIRVIRLAFEFRQRFHKDVVVDMFCYRRFGHNEADEPAYTQPRMYAVIEQMRSVRKRYTETLVNRGDLTLQEAEATLEDFQSRLEAAFQEVKETRPPAQPKPMARERDRKGGPVLTGVDRETLDQIMGALTTWPDGFTVHPKLEKILLAQRSAFDSDRVDWALAESLAFGSLVLEDTPVRLAGQDTRRGTFSQRHGVLIDASNEDEYTPLDNISENQARFMVFDSVLSEFAALGFEYGYSLGAPNTLVLWEAQFGDFSNGGQTIIDQFIAAAEDKWGQKSQLTMLLPHGYEGQGPEHSSARLERFLTLAASDNMRVTYPSTAANYFHLLRRQIKHPFRRPLVIMTPKKYLRMEHSKSSIGAFTSGHWQKVLPDRAEPDPASVKRVIFCSGKVGHELMDKRDALSAPAAVVRIEQLYPWTEPDIVAQLDLYAKAKEVFWVQEEPENMGAWRFMYPRLVELLDGRNVKFDHVTRPQSPSPATGSQTRHEEEQEEILTAAFAGL